MRFPIFVKVSIESNSTVMAAFWTKSAVFGLLFEVQSAVENFLGIMRP